MLQVAIDVPIEANVVDKIIPISDLGVFVSGIASAGLTVAALAFFIYLILGGIKWILGNGDKGKIEEARATITQGFLGLTVTVAAWAIFLLVDYFLGLGIIDSTKPAASPSKQNQRQPYQPNRVPPEANQPI